MNKKILQGSLIAIAMGLFSGSFDANALEDQQHSLQESQNLNNQQALISFNSSYSAPIDMNNKIITNSVEIKLSTMGIDEGEGLFTGSGTIQGQGQIIGAAKLTPYDEDEPTAYRLYITALMNPMTVTYGYSVFDDAKPNGTSLLDQSTGAKYGKSYLIYASSSTEEAQYTDALSTPLTLLSIQYNTHNDKSNTTGNWKNLEFASRTDIATFLGSFRSADTTKGVLAFKLPDGQGRVAGQDTLINLYNLSGTTTTVYKYFRVETAAGTTYVDIVSFAHSGTTGTGKLTLGGLTDASDTNYASSAILSDSTTDYAAIEDLTDYFADNLVTFRNARPNFGPATLPAYYYIVDAGYQNSATPISQETLESQALDYDSSYTLAVSGGVTIITDSTKLATAFAEDRKAIEFVETTPTITGIVPSNITISNDDTLKLDTNVLNEIKRISSNHTPSAYMGSIDLGLNLTLPVAQFDILNQNFRRSPVINFIPDVGETIFTLNCAISCGETDDDNLATSLSINQNGTTPFTLVLACPNSETNANAHFGRVYVGSGVTLKFNGPNSMFAPGTPIYGQGTVIFDTKNGAQAKFYTNNMPNVNGITHYFAAGASKVIGTAPAV